MPVKEKYNLITNFFRFTNLKADHRSILLLFPTDTCNKKERSSYTAPYVKTTKCTHITRLPYYLHY